MDANGKDTGGSNCWLKFQAYHDLFVETFGFEIPVLGTEGGVWCDVLADPRYPKISVDMQRDWTIEICRKMMANEYPDYYLCTGFWLMANRGMGAPTANGFENDAWYSYWRADTGGHLPVVEALKALPKKVRRGPADQLPPPQPAGASRIYGAVTDSRGAATAAAVVLLRSPAVDPRDVSADAQGKYEFTGLPAGTFTVSSADASQSVKADGKLAYKADLTISAKDAFKYVVTKKQLLSREEGSCSCVKGCGIYGTVVDNDGNPLKGVRLRVSWSGGSADVFTADPTGRYRVLLQPWRVLAGREQGRLAQRARRRYEDRLGGRPLLRQGGVAGGLQAEVHVGRRQEVDHAPRARRSRGRGRCRPRRLPRPSWATTC